MKFSYRPILIKYQYNIGQYWYDVIFLYTIISMLKVDFSRFSKIRRAKIKVEINLFHEYYFEGTFFYADRQTYLIDTDKVPIWQFPLSADTDTYRHIGCTLSPRTWNDKHLMYVFLSNGWKMLAWFLHYVGLQYKHLEQWALVYISWLLSKMRRQIYRSKYPICRLHTSTL